MYKILLIITNVPFFVFAAFGRTQGDIAVKKITSIIYQIAMNKLQKFFIKNTVHAILKIQAFLFKNQRFNALGYKLNSFIAKRTIKSKNISEAKNLEELGENWQKGFPSKKEVPITQKDEKTVYAEIHTHCPLRGTGDVNACYKMMSYDREIVEKAGGQFIVLESQSEKDVQICKIAIRFQGEDVSDLKHAHEKYNGES